MPLKFSTFVPYFVKNKRLLTYQTTVTTMNNRNNILYFNSFVV